jgi:aryl-alcohol dehydrogenase-like predicted oxidoreductase
MPACPEAEAHRRAFCNGLSMMELSPLGRSTLEVSRLGIGTMAFGATTDEPAAHRLFDEAYDAGINVGVSTGKYSAGRRPRDARLVISARYGEMYLQPRMVEIADGYLQGARKHGLDPVAMSWRTLMRSINSTISAGSYLDETDSSGFHGG